MRISADCIEGELDSNETQLSETFSRMALNENNNNMSTKEATNGEQVRVIYRYCSPSDDHNVERDGYIALTVIPIIDNNFHDGYYSNWDEVKNQVLNLNFKDRNNVPKLSFVGRIGSGICDMTLITKDDYFTALKVAELCGQPLDVMIKTAFEAEKEVEQNESTGAANNISEANNAVAPQNQLSDSENEMTEDKNEFVVLDNAQNINNDTTSVDSSIQIGSDCKSSFISRDEIEGLKQEITIDVTKRIISKLSECLSELNNETKPTGISRTSSDSGIQTNESVVNNDLSTSSEDNAQVIHHGIICDNCETQIKGIRYKCSVCLDYDLCQNCEVLPAIHNEDHSFIKIKQNIKPFKMPNRGQDIYLAVDVDLPTGKILNIGDIKVVSKPNSVPSSSCTTQTTEPTATVPEVEIPLELRGEQIAKECSALKDFELKGTSIGGVVSHQMTPNTKNRISEKKAIKIAKKLEKLKLKDQIYSSLLQTTDDRSTHKESKGSSGAQTQSQSLSSNKALLLSGLCVGDVTIPEGTRMPPGTKFRKTWKVRNTGTKVWTGRTTVRYVWGNSELEPFGKVTEIEAPQLRPGEEGKVTIRFNAPKAPVVRQYHSHWRLHHRGAPFGQRLTCRVVIDPNETGISQPHVASALKPGQPVSSTTRGAIPPGFTSEFYDVTQRLKTIKQSMIAQHNALLQANPVGIGTMPPMPSNYNSKVNLTGAPPLNPPLYPAFSNRRSQGSEKSSLSKSKDRAKHLHEALTAVKEIRFSLDDNELIPMKVNVKSHTTTPANTPFDISPPKSPEPTLAEDTMESNDNNGTNNDIKIENNLIEENTNDNEEVDSILSLSSEGSDEFEMVPYPRCFDLNVPFSDTDIKDDVTDGANANCFEVIEEPVYNDDETENLEQNVCIANEDSNCLAENLVVSHEMQSSICSECSIPEENNDFAIDLSKTKSKPQNAEQLSDGTEVNSPKPSAPQPESQPQEKPKPASPSTNPFRDSSNETENVIHVLPESIVTGALSAAAHVYNNVSRALFARNEGSDSRPFPWVTSPPPAAIPLPEYYWDSPRAQYQPREYFSTTSASTNSTLTTTSKNAGIVTTTSAPSSVMTNPSSAADPQRNRLSDALTQLYEMGFWNQKLNQELLEKNSYDVNDTIEDLLSPERGRQRRSGGSDEVVSRQPKHHNRNGFIEEFD